ncbi:MAG: T9SS type A sorting domain-containing protein [Vicingaceae bacterium]
MKKSILLIGFTFLFSYSYSQCTVPNPSFESTTVTNVGSGSITHPNSYNPYLSALLSFFSGGLPGVDSTLDAQVGNLAMDLFKDSLAGYPIGGDVLMVMPCNGFVSSVNGFYKMSNTVNDTAGLIFIATAYNANTQQRDTIGIGGRNFFSNQLNYTSFSFNPLYPSLNVSPDTITIWAFFFPSTDRTSFKLDNLSFNYLTVGTDEQQKAEKFKFYPNPAEDKLRIQTGSFRGEILQLIDLKGQLLHEVRVSEASQNLDLSQFESGIYFIRIGQHTEKLIIK